MSETNGETEGMKFFLKKKELPVTIVDEDGKEVACVLRELAGTERDAYLNIMGAQMRFNAQGKPAGVKDAKNLQASLVQKSLFRVENGLPFALVQIQGWPSSTQSALFREALKLSGLDEKSQKAIKNA